MTSDLESRKSPRKRAKAPVNAGLAGWLRGIGVRAIVLYACAYGGMVALGVALVATATGGDASAPPELPLHASAGDLTRETPLAMTPDAGRVGGPDGAGAPDGGSVVLAPVEPPPDELVETPTSGGVIVASPEDALRPPVPVPEPRAPVPAAPDATPAEAPAADVASPPPDDGCKRYPVLAGDATKTVARRLGFKMRQLRSWNPSLGSKGPEPGTQLRICSEKKTIVRWQEKSITVRGGDTVLRIARRHDLSIENVVAANGIHPDRIHAGQKLTVFEPVWE